MSDVTITQTNRDSFTGALLLAPLAALLGGVCLYANSKPKKGEPSANNVIDVAAITLAGFGAWVVYKSLTTKKTPIGTVSGLPPYEGPPVIGVAKDKRAKRSSIVPPAQIQAYRKKLGIASDLERVARITSYEEARSRGEAIHGGMESKPPPHGDLLFLRTREGQEALRLMMDAGVDLAHPHGPAFWSLRSHFVGKH